MISQKAKNLKLLSKYLNKSNGTVPKFYVVKCSDYLKNKKKTLHIISKKFKKNIKLILRSASNFEDTKNYSNAGKFSSKLSKNNINHLEKKMDGLCNSLSKKDQIIVQIFIDRPEYSGVIFTRDINDNSPYYTLNIDYSNRTDLVTSGRKNISMKTYIIHRSLKYLNKKFSKLIKTIKEIEKIFQNEKIDIEFAYKNRKIMIFQCRKLYNIQKFKNININNSLFNIEKKIDKLQKPLPFITGKKTIFSNMADWNPAEIIGVKPNSLALSLYEKLITDDVWSKQRIDFGYKNVQPYPLMYSLGGSPYIDLRIDFNSFLIKNLKEKQSKKIIDYFIKKIDMKPSLHDKIEYEIFPTYYSFSNKRYLELQKIIGKKLLKTYKRSLYDITFSSFFNDKKLKNEIFDIQNLSTKLAEIKLSKISILHKIYLTLHYCKKLGTLNFASMARKAFIASEYVNDLKSLGILNDDDIKNFYGSVNSISKNIQKDLYLVAKKKITKEKFLHEYGHLRPSTYFINNKNYSKNFENYFNLKDTFEIKNKNFKLTNKIKIKTEKLLKKNKFNYSSKSFFDHLRFCLEKREEFKLIFTKGINDIFEYIKVMGKRLNIKSNDLEHLSIDALLNNFNNLSLINLENIIKENIKLNKIKLNEQKNIKLPDLIRNSKDIYFYEKQNLKGNFITNKIIVGKIKFYKNNLKSFNNKIVVLENADPGYDFLFSYKIKGLITKYGGPNSHMAIRCAEYQIPAIIGMTEHYDDLKENQIISINCFQKKII